MPSHFSCVRLSVHDLMGCSPPGSSVHRMLQARILEWVAIAFSRGADLPVSGIEPGIAGRFFTIWAAFLHIHYMIWVIIQYCCILFNCSSFSSLAIGSSFSCSCNSLKYPPLSFSLWRFCGLRMFPAHLVYFLSQSIISHFSEKPGSLSLENGIRN